ncbi:MAG: hypothetical protein CVV41_04565 [Candidatus Riflebacteria bacterium HGW-Riflebacteria-1]|jgi:hypothetical protein|nr:MAG: hypothetical protein CVV41_04565 [Candidatus Riflebacteria bacterium HGW-Riflebacteria-1]
MKIYWVGLLSLVLLMSAVSAEPLSAKAGFSASPDVGDRFLDIHTFLYKIAARNGWSLIVSSEVNSPVREVIGSTVEDALKNYLDTTRFRWRLFENCLYVANEADLDLFFKTLPELELTMPRGQPANFNGNFMRIDIEMLCNMLRSVSGFEIRSSNDLQHSVMMRAKEMTWQRVLLAIVYLNRFRLNRTDFSITIFPAGS